jgi:hypothetical protein
MIVTVETRICSRILSFIISEHNYFHATIMQAFDITAGTVLASKSVGYEFFY